MLRVHCKLQPQDAYVSEEAPTECVYVEACFLLCRHVTLESKSVTPTSTPTTTPTCTIPPKVIPRGGLQNLRAGLSFSFVLAVLGWRQCWALRAPRVETAVQDPELARDLQASLWMRVRSRRLHVKRLSWYFHKAFVAGTGVRVEEPTCCSFGTC